MPFRDPASTEHRCIAKTERGTQCRRTGCIYAGGGRHLCHNHSRNDYIPFFPSEINPMMEMRRRAVLGLDE